MMMISDNFKQNLFESQNTREEVAKIRLKVYPYKRLAKFAITYITSKF